MKIKNKLKILITASLIVSMLAPSVMAANNQEFENKRVIINNMGHTFNRKTGVVFKDSEGIIYVPVREFTKALGIQMSWDKKYPKMITMTKGSRTVQIWLNNFLAIVDGNTEPMDRSPFQVNGITYCPLRIIADGFNLLVNESYDMLEITTEESYNTDKMIRSAMEPYEDVRFIIQKNGDNKFSTEQEKTWNFVRKLKDNRNKFYYKGAYPATKPNWGISHPGDSLKKDGPYMGWRIITPTYSYNTKDRNGNSQTIIGTTSSNITKVTEEDIQNYMLMNNYPVPQISRGMKAVAQKRSIEVAYNFKNRASNPDVFNTYTNIGIDDFVDPEKGGAIALNKDQIEDQLKRAGLKDKDGKEIDSKKDYKGNLYVIGRKNQDTYQDSLGRKMFRRYATVITPLHGNTAQTDFKSFISNYDIFRSLIFRGSKFGISSFTFESDNKWYTVSTIAVTNIDGFVSSDLNKGFEGFKEDKDFDPIRDNKNKYSNPSKKYKPAFDEKDTNYTPPSNNKTNWPSSNTPSKPVRDTGNGNGNGSGMGVN